MASINPYLNFKGNCEDAFKFYKSVFGGEFLDFQRFKEAPPQGQLSEDEGDWIMHVSLPIGEDSILMGSDSPTSQGEVINGNNFSVSIQTDNDDETDRLFNGLSAGGQVIMPLEQTFWGARFGMFVDRFDIPWMVNQANSNE